MRYIQISLLFAIFLGTISCRKLVDAGAPRSQISGTSLFSGTSGATAALLAVYAALEGNGDISYTLLPALSADELISYSTPISAYYTNSLNATVNNDFWSKYYKVIYQANDVIAKVQASAGISAADKDQVTAEATFLRAFCHFYLVNLFGDIPYITGTDYTINNNAARMSAKDSVYPHIITDLRYAQSHLGASDPSGDRTRINQAAVGALLARVYLYMGDWANAETLAGATIADADYQLETDLDNVFLNQSPETIWQLSPASVTYTNAPDGVNFILNSEPGYSKGKVSLSSFLVNAFEDGDQRKDHWVGSYTADGTTIYYYPYKYKVPYSFSPPSEYTVVMRLAEQYLIRAEARAEQNRIGDAVADINVVRNRAGLDPLSGSIGQAQCLQAILQERKVELFLEWGHRWLDLKRTGAADTVMPAVCTAKGGKWKTAWELYPIPQAQLKADVNMTAHQNPEY